MQQRRRIFKNILSWFWRILLEKKIWKIVSGILNKLLWIHNPSYVHFPRPFVTPSAWTSPNFFFLLWFYGAVTTSVIKINILQRLCNSGDGFLKIFWIDSGEFDLKKIFERSYPESWASRYGYTTLPILITTFHGLSLHCLHELAQTFLSFFRAATASVML